MCSVFARPDWGIRTMGGKGCPASLRASFVHRCLTRVALSRKLTTTNSPPVPLTHKPAFYPPQCFLCRHAAHYRAPLLSSNAGLSRSPHLPGRNKKPPELRNTPEGYRSLARPDCGGWGEGDVREGTEKATPLKCRMGGGALAGSSLVLAIRREGRESQVLGTLHFVQRFAGEPWRHQHPGNQCRLG
jgi:hypothetical protein